jgi:hypothetical protein
MAIGEKVSKDVVSISTLSSNTATTYSSMYAFGNHLQVVNVESLMSGQCRITFVNCKFGGNNYFFARVSIPFQ